MHIPSHQLSPTVEAIAGIAAATALAGCWWKARQTAQPRSAASFPVVANPTAGLSALLAGLVFALQMLNYPISTQSSGHVLGGFAVALIVGPWRASIIVSLVLIVQAVLFADGGLTTLGANILNMALIGVWSGWIALKISSKSNSRGMQFLMVALCGWISMQAAAFSCATELLMSGQQSLLISKLLAVHTVIGLGDAFLAVIAFAVASYVPQHLPHRTQGKSQWAYLTILVCAIVAVGFSPLASALPDGLEWTLKQSGLQSEPVATAWQLSDYQIPGWGESLMSLWLAGIIGVAVVIASTWGATLPSPRRHVS